MSSSDLNLSDFFDFSLYYAKDYSPPEITPTTNENLSIRQSLETYTSSLNPDCFPDSELTRNNYSSMDLDVLEDQHYTTPTHWDGIAGFFPPLHSDIILDIPKPFDGEISVKDTYTADIQRYMKRTGKVPNVNVFTSEDDDVDTIVAHTSSDDVSSDFSPEIPSTPIRRQVVPLPKRINQLVSRSSSVTESDTSDYAPTTGANSDHTARVKVPTPAPVFHTPKDEPPTKKAKRRKTFNSACAVDNLVSFAPVLTPANIATRTAHSGSPLASSSGSSNTEAHTLCKAVMTKKRKLNDIDRDEDFDESDDDENVTVKERREQQGWTRVPDKDYSSQRINGKTTYRCDLCWEQEKRSHSCRSQGDMARHLQSEKHAPKAFMCSNPHCTKNYTRKDALKRHMTTCKFSTTNYAR